MNAPPEPRSPRPPDPAGAIFLLFATANGLLCVFLVASAVLRETPAFWRNEGGYPALLRQIVLWSFYPALALVLATTSGFTLWSVRLAKGSRAAGFLGLVILAIEWMFVAATLYIVLANNLENILRGFPVHSHP